MSGSFLIDFDQPIPIFPLHSVVLFPQTVQPLHIFERRYRQMVEDSIEKSPTGDSQDGPPIAMAVTDVVASKSGVFSEQPVRPVVCIGRILQDERLPDGRHNILVHGICRAKIRSLMDPEGDRLYRSAMMRPIESSLSTNPSPVVRDALRQLLMGDRLSRMHASEAVRSWIDRDDVPVETLIEMASFVLVKDEAIRYRLLEEPDPSERARIVHSELEHIDRLVMIGDRQAWRSWPKNLSWN
jgi:Lon protease-like protein